VPLALLLILVVSKLLLLIWLGANPPLTEEGVLKFLPERFGLEAIEDD
jgi:hypothetical protein